MTFLTVGALTFHLQLSGDPALVPLVLLNPVGSDLRVWDALVERLPPGLRVIRYDLRGQGLSDAPEGAYRLTDHVTDLKGLLDTLGLARISLAGCSLGGLVAQAFALTFPEQVERLVLLDTLPRIGSPEGWTERIEQVRARGLRALAPELIRRWFAPGYFEAQPDAARGYTNLLAGTPLSGYLGSCAALRDADLTPDIPSLKPPTLVLCGDQDLSTPPEACRAFAEQIGARFALIPGSAHLPMVEQPARVAELFRAFFQGPGAGPTENRYEQGLSVRRRVLGEAHVERALANAGDLDRDFQRFITEYAWGGPWSRGHFDLRTRHLLTLAVLTALPREHELELHVRATRNTGVSTTDLREVFMHVAVYAGVPVANRAFAIARSVLGEEP